MKDQIVKLLIDRVGLDQAKAGQAVDTVLGFLRENPEKLQGFLSSEQGEKVLEKLDGVLPGGAAKKLTGFLNRD